MGQACRGNSPGPFTSLAPACSLFSGWGSHIWSVTLGACVTTDRGLGLGGGGVCFSNKPLKACSSITAPDWSLLLPPRVFGFRTETLESRENNNNNDENRQNNEHHKVCARQHGPCAPRGVGALGIPTKRPRQKKLKAARRKGHLTAGGTASPSMLFGKKKKKNC